jgi:hypothetical protein
LQVNFLVVLEPAQPILDGQLVVVCVFLYNCVGGAILT